MQSQERCVNNEKTRYGKCKNSLTLPSINEMAERLLLLGNRCNFVITHSHRGATKPDVDFWHLSSIFRYSMSHSPDTENRHCDLTLQYFFIY
ncbi:hypothetical protein L596_017202 [Steinernema carpocapsae]|uniref:Uncharacterized protein n=1 Tax=Steinernema carpocapsae TaxID=34508 RepID=A0A4U5N171_STECR|nr:hypothetical protein L596_017202 [Steinernema carpocapsae]